MEHRNPEITTWKKEKAKLAGLRPEIVKLINEIPGANEFPMIRVRHPYLAPLFTQGQYHFHIDGKPIKHNDNSISKEIKTLLGYHWGTIPCGVLTHNTVEPRTHTFSHSAPYSIIPKNTIYSLMSLFEDQNPGYYLPSGYTLSSGCSSILLLPQLSDVGKNNALHKKYGLSQKIYPKTFIEQSDFLRQLCASKSFESDWYSETLLFSKNFVQDTPEHAPLLKTFLKMIWDVGSFIRYPEIYEILWRTFIENIVIPEYGSLYKRSATHIMDVVRHVVGMAMGKKYGFVPATDDSTAPISKLIDIYLDEYKSRFYHPIIMTVGNYNEVEPVYYSMQRHMYFSPTPVLTNSRKTVQEMELIRNIICRFQEAVINNDPKLGFDLTNTILPHKLSKVHFDFYHPQAPKNSSLISNIESIFHEDPRFQKVHRVSSESQLDLPSTSLFFKGCIRVQPLKKTP